MTPLFPLTTSAPLCSACPNRCSRRGPSVLTCLCRSSARNPNENSFSPTSRIAPCYTQYDPIVQKSGVRGVLGPPEGSHAHTHNGPMMAPRRKEVPPPWRLEPACARAWKEVPPPWRLEPACHATDYHACARSGTRSGGNAIARGLANHMQLFVSTAIVNTFFGGAPYVATNLMRGVPTWVPSVVELPVGPRNV